MTGYTGYHLPKEDSMKKAKRLFLLTVLTLSVCFVVAGWAAAAAYPDRSIKAVVYSGAGGPLDTIARGILPVLQEKIGKPVAIVNMPGAAGGTGAYHVMGQPKDGYTIMFGSESMSTWQVMGTSELSPKDFIPIKLTSQAIPVLAVPPQSRFKTSKEFLDYAIAHPGELRIATAGPGTIPHVTGLLLTKELGCKFTFIPYASGSASVIAVLGGQVDGTIEMLQGMVESHKAGKVNLLATLTNEPVVGLNVPALGKEVPKMAKYLPYGPYFGLFVAKGTAPEIVKVLEAKMGEAIKDKRWVDYCDRLYILRLDYSGDAAVHFIEDWTSKTAWLIYEGGIAPNSPEKFGIKKLAN